MLSGVPACREREPKLDVRPNQLARASEGGREGGREGGGARGGRVPAPAECRGLAARPARVAAPARLPAAGRERAAAGRSIPARQPAGGPPATRHLLLRGRDEGVRTSKSPREESSSQNDQRRPRHTSSRPGLPPEHSPTWGRRQEEERAPFPYGVAVGGPRVGAPISAGGPGTPAARCEGERAAGSWFPRPGALRVPLVSQVSTGFCQRRGAVLAPAQPGVHTGGSGEEAQSRGSVGRKERPREWRDPCASRPPRASPHPTPNPLPPQPLRAGPCAPGLASRRFSPVPAEPPARGAETRPGSASARRDARPGGCTEGGWRGGGVVADVRWEGEAEGGGLSPRRTATRQSRQDSFSHAAMWS